MNTTPNPGQLQQNVTLVDLLTWVYRDQMAHRMSDRQLALSDEDNRTGERRRVLVDSCAQLLRDQPLGAFIPSTGNHQRLVLHPDAEAVHEALCRMSQHDAYGALLIFRHGLWGEIPDYGIEQPRPHPVYAPDKRGRDRIVQTTCKDGDGHLEQRRVRDPQTGRYNLIWVEMVYPYCPLTYWPTLTSVAASRLDYRMWFNALRLLYGMLPPLRQWQVRGIGAESTPWGWDNDNEAPA